jgi:hypothetical protein
MAVFFAAINNRRSGAKRAMTLRKAAIFCERLYFDRIPKEKQWFKPG